MWRRSTMPPSIPGTLWTPYLSHVPNGKATGPQCEEKHYFQEANYSENAVATSFEQPPVRKSQSWFWMGHLRSNPGVTASAKFGSWRKTESLNNLSQETKKHRLRVDREKREKSWDGSRGKSTWRNQKLIFSGPNSRRKAESCRIKQRLSEELLRVNAKHLALTLSCIFMGFYS